MGFKRYKKPCRGTLEDLETQLLDDSTYKSRVDKLLRWDTALKTYMRRLTRDRPDKFKCTKSNGQHFWEINAPEN